MQKKIEDPALLDLLPLRLKKAQQAIELPEVQEMIEKLSKYNLGVYMPHRHNETNGNFEILPDSQVQIENDLKVSFMSRQESDQLNALPVGWIWKKNGALSAATCSLKCSLETSPTTGAIVHIKKHKE